MSYVLKGTQLKKIFEPNHGTAAVNGIDISISKGEFIVIMGNSGSGKSTLLHLLSGLEDATEGHVELNGELMNTRSESSMAGIRRNKIGFVFQDHNLLPNLTLRDNVLIAGLLTSLSKELVRRRADDLFAEMDIQDLGNRFPAEVSGGQKQRFAIARAMINRPEIIIADEPTGNLNSAASNKVLECFSAARNKGQSILMVTHDPNSASYGDIVILMKDGKFLDTIVFEDSVSKESKKSRLLNWLSGKEW